MTDFTKGTSLSIVKKFKAFDQVYYKRLDKFEKKKDYLINDNLRLSDVYGFCVTLQEDQPVE